MDAYIEYYYANGFFAGHCNLLLKIRLCKINLNIYEKTCLNLKAYLHEIIKN